MTGDPEAFRPAVRVGRRAALAAGVGGAALLVMPPWLRVASAGAATGEWKAYPYRLFGDPVFTFPGIEGATTNETDTWYVGGKLAGLRSGRQFAFMTIFAKNRLGGRIRADFYTFALFDLDTGDYGTFTEQDFPPVGLLGPPKLTLRVGHLDLAATTAAGRATWATRTDRNGALVPFAYRLGLRGEDQIGRRLALDADLDPQNRPSAVGGELTRGYITCFGQPRTGTYFQTSPLVRGTLVWGDHQEPVAGRVGHIDRQFFPRYAGIHAGPLARDRSHEWRSVNLDDGSDLSIWRQFDRRHRNAVEPFSGATRYQSGTDRTDYAPDVVVTNMSYVKWPSSVATFVPPPSPNRYLAAAHQLAVPEWDLTLTATPLVAAPAHALPVEYMTGPMDYQGTLAGQPVSGFGMSERTLALYRDWELVDVLRVSVTRLPAQAFIPGAVSRAELRQLVEDLGLQVDNADRVGAHHTIETRLRPAVRTLAPPHRPFLDELLHDLDHAPA